MMKKTILSFLILALVAPVFAQVQTCAVTGTVYNANGQPFAGATITVHRVRKANVLLRATPQKFLTNAQGQFSILLPRDSFAWIEAPIDGFFIAGGLPVRVPDAGSAELLTLEPVFKFPESVPVGVPPAGTLGIRDNGSALGLFDTVDFKAGFDLTDNAGVIEIVSNPAQALGFTPANAAAPFITISADANLSNETLLNAVIGKGTLASRPAAGIAGRLYYVTDSGSERWTRDNGSSWEDAPIHWTQVLGKPSTFTPSAHTHVKADVTDFTHGASSHSGNVFPNAPQDLANYIDIGEISAPTNPASGKRRLFVDQATGKLSVRTSSGTIVSLEDTLGTSVLNDLSDVTISGPSAGHYIRHNGTIFVNSGLQAIDLPTAIDAAKIADGSISNTEYQALNNISGNIQSQIDGKQAAGNDLTALEALASTGIAARTATDTWALRTIIGTTNRITVTNGNGVSGNPALDIGSDVVTLNGSQTLTNKILTNPTIASIINTGTVSFPTSTDTLVGKATTDILTNKTLDAEGTGNVLTTVSKILFDGGACNGATATANWDLPTSNAPTSSCTGTTTTVGTLDFADGSTTSATRQFRLPSDWTGNIDVNLLWLANAASSNAVRWQVSCGCKADSESIDTGPSYNTASASNTAYTGTANQRKTTSFTSISTTNCAASETLWLRIERVGGDGGDTLAATARLLQVEVTIRRAQ